MIRRIRAQHEKTASGFVLRVDRHRARLAICRVGRAAERGMASKFVSMFAGMRARGMTLAAPVLAMPSVAVARAGVEALGADLASLAPWGLPLGMFGMWFIWPAVKPEFKISIGAMKAPPSGTEFKFEKEEIGEAPSLAAGSVG